MTGLLCSYSDDREAAIVTFLYEDPGGNQAERTDFELHLRTCERCQADVAALRGVRAQLARWSPPEAVFSTHAGQSGIGQPKPAVPSWRTIPAWAQVAAALLFLGVSAGIANLDIQYNQGGLTVRTGWSARAGGSSASTVAVAERRVPSGEASVEPTKNAPWRADIAALERQLKSEIHAVQASPAAGATVRTVSAPSSDADVTRRVRAIVEESEKRQQRELALRLAELARDVTAQRQADMVKIDRTLGLVQNNVGIEVMRTREKMNQMDLIYRASQRQ